MRISAYLSIGLALGMLACSDTIPPPSPPSFGRPQRVAFACFNPDGTEVLPLDQCYATLDCKTADPMLPAHHIEDCDPQPTTGTVTVTASVNSLNALVTQSNRGELAAVDLVTNQVIDARQDIPGYTFVPTGELPGPIVVRTKNPAMTYVANAGSRDISVIHTLDVHHLPVRTTVSDVRVPVRSAPDQAAQAPADMVLSPAEDALFVTAPDGSWLLRLPIEHCDPMYSGCHEGQIDTAHIVRVPIENSLDKAPTDEAPEGDDKDPYSQICDPTKLLPLSKVVDAQLGTPADRTPRPAGLAIDAFCKDGDPCQHRLLVADRNLPIVHVIDIDVLAAGNASDAVLTPIVTGVPTERVAVSPRVPIDLDGKDGETQYVYAIDSNDGSVLVTQNGRVINVTADPSMRADRLDVGESTATGKPIALSLEVLTPRFRTNIAAASNNVAENPGGASDSIWACGNSLYPTRTATLLRGVFLAVGLTDGTVRIMDVYDGELPNCRSCTVSADAYDPYPVYRHRQRIAAIPATGTDVAPAILTPSVTPQFQINTSAIFVNTDGTTSDPRIAGLACVACTGNQAASFPIVTTATPTAGTGGTVQDAGVAGGGETAGSGGAAGGGGAGGSGADIVNGACAANEGRVCSLSDPWVDPLTWLAYREGTVPGAQGGLGRFEDPANSTDTTVAFAASDARFCDNGVLGDDDIGDVDDNGDPDGDQLLITSVLPDANLAKMDQTDVSTGTDRATCEALVAARDNNDQPIAFRIKQAFADHLVIEQNAIQQQSAPRGRAVTYASVRACFLDTLLTYEVHARGSYIVVSNNGPGFVHNVMTDASTKRCKVDAANPKQAGRAYDAVLFDNGYISFKTLRAPTQRDVLMSFPAATNVPKLVMDATAIQGGNVHGVLPVQLKYNPIDERLYIVDITTRGLIPVPLDAFPSAVLSSFE